MALKIGNILNSTNINRVKGAVKENIAGASALGGGLKAIGKSLLDEAIGISNTPQAQSPYPLGDEWQPDPAYVVTIAFTDPNTGTLTDVQGYMPETVSIGIGAEFSSPLESVGEALSSGPVGATARLFGYKVSANLFSMLLWSGSSHIDMTLEMRFVALRDTKQDVIDPIRKLYTLVTPSIESFSVTPGAVQLGMVKAPGPVLEFAGDGDLTEGAKQTAGELTNAVGKVNDSLVSNANDVLSGDKTLLQGAANLAGATVEAGGSAINNVLKNIRVKNNISIVLGQFAYLKSVVVKDVSPAYNVKADEDGNWTDATVSIQISTFVSPTNIDIPDLVGFQSGNSSDTKDPTSVDAGLAALAGGGLAGALSKVNATVSKVGGLEELAKSAGLDVKLPKAGKLLEQLNMNPQTKVGQLQGELFDNLASVGKDAGLATKVVTGESDFKLGMSSLDATNFNSAMLIG